MWKKIEKYYRTVSYLKKSQIKFLVKNRLERKKKAITKAVAPVLGTLPLWMDRLDAHPDYEKRFDRDEILSGTVTLLHESGTPGGHNWANPDKSHLWNFNLQYLEFLIPLAAAYRETGEQKYYEKFREYCLRWMDDNEDGTGDGWHPYTISLRLTNLWICMDGFGEIFRKDEEFAQKLGDSMYAQYLHLQKKLELHLLGNHYLENLKAVMLGALYFKEPGVYDDYKSRLREELEEQILPDGMHYERSPMYHKIVLEDLMRAAKGVEKADRLFYEELGKKIKKMADVMYSLEDGMGQTPLFNDSGDNVARSMVSLLAALREEFGITPDYKASFTDAGYYCLRSGDVKVLLDAGAIAPDYMPGHGHCDGLSFELSRQGRPVFVNSGTGMYQGALRGYFRSTAAHNTVMIDGEEQSECWGEHRVARRISEVTGSAGSQELKGRLTTASGRKQGRCIRAEGSSVEIWDQVDGHADAYFHLAPDYHYEEAENSVLVKEKDDTLVCRIIPEKQDQVKIYRDGTICSYAPEFGKIEQIQVLALAWEGDGSEHMIQIIFEREREKHHD